MPIRRAVDFDPPPRDIASKPLEPFVPRDIAGRPLTRVPANRAEDFDPQPNTFTKYLSSVIGGARYSVALDAEPAVVASRHGAHALFARPWNYGYGSPNGFANGTLKGAAAPPLESDPQRRLFLKRLVAFEPGRGDRFTFEGKAYSMRVVFDESRTRATEQYFAADGALVCTVPMLEVSGPNHHWERGEPVPAGAPVSSARPKSRALDLAALVTASFTDPGRRSVQQSELPPNAKAQLAIANHDGDHGDAIAFRFQGQTYFEISHLVGDSGYSVTYYYAASDEPICKVRHQRGRGINSNQFQDFPPEPL